MPPRKGPQGPQSYPARPRTSFYYAPVTGVCCYLMMIIGVGLWAHYLQDALNKSKDMQDITLSIFKHADASVADLTQGALIATCVVFILIGLVVLGNIIYRTKMESDQDLRGSVDDGARFFHWGCWVAAAAWWIVMLWVVLMICACGVFSGITWVAKQALSDTQAQRLACPLTANCTMAAPPVLTGLNCPDTCFTPAQIGVLSGAQLGVPVCICDDPTLKAAYDAASAANADATGALVGIFLMYIFGQGLAHALTHAQGMVRKELMIAEIVSSS